MSETGQDALDGFPDAGPSGTGLSGRAREHGTAVRRRAGRRRRPVLMAVGAVVVAAGGVIAALVAVSGTDASQALAAVTGALAKSSADSYSFSLDSTVLASGRQMGSDVVSGAIGPGHGLGTELLVTSVENRLVRAQIRFVGRYVYTRVSAGSGFGTVGKPWDKAPVPPTGTSQMQGSYGFVSDQPVSPGELLGVLQSAAAVRLAGLASGPGWTGVRYTFTARLSSGQGSVSGTVYVDRQGQLRRLLTITSQGSITTDRDLTIGNYGAPVPVTAPPASQAKYTSTPYWGFFF